MLGRAFDLHSLLERLRRVSAGNPEQSENRAATMLGSGKLASFYSEYANFGKTDAAFLELLDFLTGKSLAEQLAYAGAMCEPGEYVWPDGAETAAGGRMGFIKSLPAPPLSKKYISDVAGQYVVPDALHEMLRSAGTYSEGESKLEYLKRRGLLMARGSDEASLKNLSLDGYERMARVRNFGHTAEVMRVMGDIAGYLGDLRTRHPDLELSETLSRFDHLRENKISRRDLDFIDALSELFSKRESSRGLRWIKDAAGLIIAALILWTFRATQAYSDEVWALGSVISAGVSGIFLLARAGLLSALLWNVGGTQRSPISGGGNRAGGMEMILVGPGILLALLLFTPLWPPGLVTAVSGIFPVFGTPAGPLIADLLYASGMKKNLAKIIAACREYNCGAPPGGLQ
jgi:hypothetical protein